MVRVACVHYLGTERTSVGNSRGAEMSRLHVVEDLSTTAGLEAADGAVEPVAAQVLLNVGNDGGLPGRCQRIPVSRQGWRR
jgi:hypothetical protein